MPDATSEFKQQLREAFDALQVGQMFAHRRTFSEGDVALFIGVTGNFNPYHQDELFAIVELLWRRIEKEISNSPSKYLELLAQVSSAL